MGCDNPRDWPDDDQGCHVDHRYRRDGRDDDVRNANPHRGDRDGLHNDRHGASCDAQCGRLNCARNPPDLPDDHWQTV